MHQHSYAFYCINVQPGLVLRVKVTTVRGDPDLYMCNRHTHPTHEEHTWRATGVGDDVIKIKPDHPNAVPGTYYISVYGVQVHACTHACMRILYDLLLRCAGMCYMYILYASTGHLLYLSPSNPNPHP